MISAGTHIAPADFNELYFLLREKEGRLYTDEEIRLLPFITSSHPYFKEWVLRKQSSDRLINYLIQKHLPLKILEVGCGNGWLSHQLSAIPQSTVIGTDINYHELQQAARVFSGITNLQFIYSDIQSGIFKEKGFDIIIFAASMQYFSSFREIITISMQFLKPPGEIHIIDSHFYDPKESAKAKERSDNYFTKLGMIGMMNWYHHHTTGDLGKFNHTILYKPSAGVFHKRENPFPWIMIRNEIKE